jgi:GWxTD domain-containing protein
MSRWRRPALLLPLLLGACTSWQRVGADQAPSPAEQAANLLDPYALYARLGHFVSTDAIHYVGTVAFVPGTGDSTRAVVGISLQNRVFGFQRAGDGYTARYRVEYTFRRAGAPPIQVSRNESIQVASFQETLRSDESVLLQQQLNLVPGDYEFSAVVRDLGTAAAGTATQQVTAPAFGPASYTTPIMVYTIKGRGRRSDSLEIVMNPRGTVAYGGDTLLAYFEGYGYTGPAEIPLQVRDERDSLVYHTAVHFNGTGGVESRYVRILPDSTALGQLEIILGPDNAVRKASAVVSFSTAWIVTNFDQMLDMLRYFGHDAMLSRMRKAQSGSRAELWRDFYKATDPNPATPENEALEVYFGRMAIANQRFRDEGIPGWRTDRGEVFIAFGDPDEMYDASPQLQGAGRYYRWTYTDLRVDLYFQDVTGFGRYRLTPQSRADFERVKFRVQKDN